MTLQRYSKFLWFGIKISSFCGLVEICLYFFVYQSYNYFAYVFYITQHFVFQSFKNLNVFQTLLSDI